MKSDIKSFDIVFSGLGIGQHSFVFEIKNDFFETFEYDGFNHFSLKAIISLEKQVTALKLNFKINGTVNVNCDISNRPFDLDVNSNWELIVKFSDTYKYDGDQILWIPHGEHKINVAHYIYETLILNMPMKKVHPETLNEESIENISFERTYSDLKNTRAPKIDPRWQKLENLLNQQ